MNLNQETISAAAQRMGIAPEDLAAVVQQGGVVSYESGAYLFHESTPRLWLGIVLDGEVEVQRGAQARSVILATLKPGAILSEGVMLDDSPHATSATAPRGAAVWQITRAILEKIRAEKPDIYYRIAGRVAARLSDRIGLASGRIAGEHGPAEISAVRREHDSLGERDVPDHAYYGVQTIRGVENFPLSGIHLYHFRHFVNGLALVKKAAALANGELGVLEQGRAEAIVKACDEILAGKLHDQFVIDMFQGGAGTSTNMNANEVIANRALEILGHKKGEYQHLHPNDHVNCSQSTNDAYPTAIKLGVILTLQDTLSALRELRTALENKAKEFADVLKMGRTENQDAVPMTLGQEFGAYSVMIGDGIRHLKHAGGEFLAINMGATAIGTGLNSPPGYAALCTQRLAEVSGIPVTLAGDLVEATQDSGEFSLMSGTMKTAAVQLSKICNDLRWLSSGPRCGLYEIKLPPMQPGSSIMPGKVNPVVPEVVSQICFQIIGADVTVSMAAEASELELNMAEPVIAFNLLFGLTLLRNAAIILNSRCISGIEANRERCLAYVHNSIGLVTALNPVLGYERSAAIAKEALKTGGSVYDLVLQKGWLTREQLDDLLKPENMTHPRQV
ncbi:aspartate ammonia-lyase [Verrucomicrobium sp. BvORR106]|uniref:aspartate ammonia-lyase n=1 Tax=Verrucomicrobium sp. BvORR106 TaxID=1403819 RepID=UPI0009DE916F|nr:aspartate ammonia-lyase [Verrucomicrobium sp. BvORR106]